MTGQTDLLEWGDELARSRATDPTTSYKAAGSVNVADGRAKVMALLSEGPATDATLLARARARGVLISDSGLRTRRAELTAQGLVRDSGRVEKSPSGRASIVWEVNR